MLIWSVAGGVLAYGLVGNYRLGILVPEMEKPVQTVKDIVDQGKIPFTEYDGELFTEMLETSSYSMLVKKLVIPTTSEDEERLIHENAVAGGTHVMIGSLARWDKLGLDYRASKHQVAGLLPFTAWMVNKKWALTEDLQQFAARYQQVCSIGQQ